MSKFWSSFVQDLEPYVPGEQPKVQDLIKLNTNENPYPPSPKVKEALNGEQIDLLRLYPDPNSTALKQTLADYHGLDQNQVFIGNGSDDVLALTFMALFSQKNKPLLFPDISYSFYPVYAKLFNIEPRKMPLNDQFEIEVDKYDLNDQCSGIIFPNPNAPTSIGITLDKIEALLKANSETVVVVDEAYIDFADNCESACKLINQYPNLLVIQTLSKSRSLAGSRVGFALAQAELIEGLVRVKDSFNSYPLDRLAELAAITAFEDKEYFQQGVQAIIESRNWTTEQLQQLGFEVLPSQANFVMAKPTSKPAEEVFTSLREKKIIVRYFNKPRIGDYLRITIGTPEEMQALISALKDILV